jgi:hypothetical protein
MSSSLFYASHQTARLSQGALGAELENRRQEASGLRILQAAMATQCDCGSRELAESSRGRILVRQLVRVESAIARLERDWITYLLRAEQCARRRLCTPASFNHSAPLRLPAEIWGCVLDFLGMDDSTLTRLNQVDKLTKQTVQEAREGLAGEALHHPLLQDWQDPASAAPLESRLARLQRAGERLRDPAFLLSEKGLLWTQEARNNRSSSALRMLGEELVLHAVDLAQAALWEGATSPSWWSDPLFALHCALKDVSCLHRIDASLAFDRDFVLAVCSRVGRALSYLPHEWRGDREVLRATFRQVGREVRCHPMILASDPLRNDEELAREAITARCDAYECLAKRLKAMPDLAILAVSQSYHAYCWIPRSLAMNVEVAIAACRQNPIAFKLLCTSLQRHPELAPFRYES